MPTPSEQDADAVRRALAMLKNRGVDVTIGEAEFGTAFRSMFSLGKFLITGIGAAYFYLFIIEESVQTAGFGVFTLMQGKLWREAYVQNLKYREMIEIGKTSTELLSFKQDPKLSENYLIGAIQLLKMPLDAAEQIVKELLGMKEGPIEWIFMPYKAFFEAAEATADANDARIASEIHTINPDYKNKVDAEKKRFTDDKFKLQTAHQERIDSIALEKKQRSDELAIEVKIELQKVAADVRKKVITRSEADNAKILIEQEKDKIQVAIKQEFDERERAEKETHRNEIELMTKIHENRLADMREEAFHTGTPTGPISPLPTTPPPESFTAKVIKVVDGDTFDVPSYRIRAVGINAAELGTEQGTKDADFAEILLANKEVTIKVDPEHQFDKFGRVLGVVFVDGKNAQLELLRSCHARLDLREPNKYVDTAAFEQAAQECLTGTPQQPPAPTPPSAPPAPTPPQAPPEVPTDAEIINLVNIWKVDIIPKVEIITQLKFAFVPGVIVTDLNKPNIIAQMNFEGANIEINRPVFLAMNAEVIKITIAHELTHAIQFQNNIQSDGTAEFNKWLEDYAEAVAVKIRNNNFAPLLEWNGRDNLGRKLIKPPFAVDVDNLTGLSHSVEFGLLSPVETIGAVRGASNLGIVARREFSIDEVRRTEVEILAVRLSINERFVNTEIMDFDYELVRPDGTSLIVPESAAEKLPTPSSQGFQYWNWAKFASVFNGIGGDLTGAGIYKLIIKADTGGVMSGTYELYFNVI